MAAIGRGRMGVAAAIGLLAPLVVFVILVSRFTRRRMRHHIGRAQAAWEHERAKWD